MSPLEEMVRVFKATAHDPAELVRRVPDFIAGMTDVQQRLEALEAAVAALVNPGHPRTPLTSEQRS
jgi:dGTP triphosphohydrolase